MPDVEGPPEQPPAWTALAQRAFAALSGGRPKTLRTRVISTPTGPIPLIEPVDAPIPFEAIDAIARRLHVSDAAFADFHRMVTALDAEYLAVMRETAGAEREQEEQGDG